MTPDIEEELDDIGNTSKLNARKDDNQSPIFERMISI
jgi:hypothetical protein